MFINIGKKENEGKCRKMKKKLADLYARLTNRSQEEIIKLCESSNMSVWQLAQKEGNADKLKDAMLSAAREKLLQMVKEGKMTQQEMDKKLEQMKNRLTEGLNEKD